RRAAIWRPSSRCGTPARPAPFPCSGTVHLLLGPADVAGGSAVGAVLAAAADQRVLALAAVELVVAVDAFQVVGAGVSDEHVRVLRAVGRLHRAERVVARAAAGRALCEADVHPGCRVEVVDPVATGAAVDVVVTGTSAQVVGSGETVDRVVAG